LPDGTSADLQLLVKALLNKDKDKRPNIFDVAKIPCVHRAIEQFIQQHDCKDEVMAFFDVDPIVKQSSVSEKKENSNS